MSRSSSPLWVGLPHGLRLRDRFVDILGEETVEIYSRTLLRALSLYHNKRRVIKRGEPINFYVLTDVIDRLGETMEANGEAMDIINLNLVTKMFAGVLKLMQDIGSRVVPSVTSEIVWPKVRVVPPSEIAVQPKKKKPKHMDLNASCNFEEREQALARAVEGDIASHDSAIDDLGNFGPDDNWEIRDEQLGELPIPIPPGDMPRALSPQIGGASTPQIPGTPVPPPQIATPGSLHGSTPSQRMSHVGRAPVAASSPALLRRMSRGRIGSRSASRGQGDELHRDHFDTIMSRVRPDQTHALARSRAHEAFFPPPVMGRAAQPTWPLPALPNDPLELLDVRDRENLATADRDMADRIQAEQDRRSRLLAQLNRPARRRRRRRRAPGGPEVVGERNVRSPTQPEDGAQQSSSASLSRSGLRDASLSVANMPSVSASPQVAQEAPVDAELGPVPAAPPDFEQDDMNGPWDDPPSFHADAPPVPPNVLQQSFIREERVLEIDSRVKDRLFMLFKEAKMANFQSLFPPEEFRAFEAVRALRILREAERVELVQIAQVRLGLDVYPILDAESDRIEAFFGEKLSQDEMEKLIEAKGTRVDFEVALPIFSDPTAPMDFLSSIGVGSETFDDVEVSSGAFSIFTDYTRSSSPASPRPMPQGMIGRHPLAQLGIPLTKSGAALVQAH